MKVPTLLFLAAAAAALAADAPAPAPATTPTPAPKAKAPPRPLSDVPSPARTKDNVEFAIGPDYTHAAELKERAEVPKGTTHDFTMNSEDSKIYPGIARGQKGVVPYKRRVTVYVPANYVAGTSVPVIIGQDGNYRDFLPRVLDNMIHDKRVPAMVAVMINSGGGDAQGSQRGLEYDTVSGLYSDFIETEVLPRIEKDYGITFTKDPEGRATMGGSSGAAAAFTMAWFHPERYRRVLSYSGTYVNQQSPLNLDAPRDQWIYQPASPRGAWEYHAKFIPESERKPIKIWLHVSDEDNGATRDESSFRNWVLANQRMAAALKAKGYTYRYVFSEKSGHTDGRVIRQTLPGALEWLWAGYKAKP
jgi:enterochelin esterase family protein